ncbi:REP-associated tyrosine transposase [Priestia koreensis]|uniref:REP-associated tyrosine transposase n=1 Tax=Priestia koreensis TaxID=284581 RepID=UPI000A53D971|nr:transposase [Priestia koreensis]
MKTISRKPRIWYPGSIYHVTCRGNRREAIFYREEDYEYFLNLVDDTKRKWPFQLHAYCLMTNHVHLLVQTDHHPQYMMKMLESQYAVYFNKKYRYEGHLFQGRYKSEIITDRNYFLTVSRYIHLNPVKAKMVARPYEYPWSSYASYIYPTDCLRVTTDRLLSCLPHPPRAFYQYYVEESKKDVESYLKQTFD